MPHEPVPLQFFDANIWQRGLRLEMCWRMYSMRQ